MGFNRKLKRNRKLPVVSSRECGPCTACCTVLGVPPLTKEPYEPCSKVCEQGCSIYQDRPEPCREFSCLWKQGLFEDDHRPDKLGLMFSLTGEDGKLGQIPIAWEVRTDASNERPARRVIQALIGKFPVLIAGEAGKRVLVR